MRDDIRASLTLPDEPGLLPLARDLIARLGATAGLAPDDVAALEQAVERSCTDLFRYAFGPGDPAALTIEGTITLRELTVAIRARGLPLESPFLGDAAAAVRTARPDWRGLLALVDRAEWLGHGPEGDELRLVKLRPRTGEGATDSEPGGEAVAATPADAEVPLAPEQEYTVRRLRPEEAIVVSQMIYRIYGYTYPVEDVYYPERVARLNETGQLISVVALDQAGEVVGLYALERPDLGPVAEAGQAIVLPAHRHRGLMERMRAFVEAEAIRLGLRGVYGEPVTAHPYSQQTSERTGASLVGISLGRLPRTFSAHGAQASLQPQRESTMLYYKPLNDDAPRLLCAPPRHRAMLERIYARLRLPVQFAEGAERVPSGCGAGRLDVALLPGFAEAEIKVRAIGTDSAAEIRQAKQDLAGVAGVEVIFLLLPLAQPGTPALCDAAEAEGFFFAGIGPCFLPDGDALRLQYLNVPLDTARLKIYSDFGRELLAYVDAERARVATLAGQATDLTAAPAAAATDGAAADSPSTRAGPAESGAPSEPVSRLADGTSPAPGTVVGGAATPGTTVEPGQC